MHSSLKTKRIRALDRGLQLVEILARKGASSLTDLRYETKLTNATLLRILATLQDRGWIRRNIVEGKFELSHSLGEILGEHTRADPIAELAAPILLSLKEQQRGLPSEIATVIGPGKIKIIESTRLRGPMAPTRTSLGLHLSMIFSAHGRAMLAFLPKDQAELHLNSIRLNGTKEEKLWIDKGNLDEELRKTRERGFGIRHEDYWEEPFDSGPPLGAIAVAIPSSRGLYGTLSLMWILDEMNLEELIDFGGTANLKQAAAKIGLRLEKASLPPPVLSFRKFS